MSLGWLAPPDSAQAVSAFCFPNDYRISALKVQGWSLYLQPGHRDCSMAKIQKNRGEEERFENAVEEPSLLPERRQHFCGRLRTTIRHRDGGIAENEDRVLDTELADKKTFKLTSKAARLCMMCCRCLQRNPRRQNCGEEHRRRK